MKRLAILATLLLSPLSAFAQTPVQITQQLILNVKNQGSLDPVIDKIDWDGAYDRMDPAQRAQMGIRSAAALKAHDIESYQGMGSKVSNSIKEVIKKAPRQPDSPLNVMNQQLEQSLADQKVQAKRNFQETVYTIGKATVGENTAQIELLKNKAGVDSSQILEFTKVHGEWKLKSGAAFNPSASQNKLESTLGTSIASPDEAVLRRY